MVSWRLLRYEKYLNKTEDVSFVVSHYISQGFRVEDKSNAAATSIMEYVRERFYAQMSIFRREMLNIKPKILHKGKRKRGSRPRPANTVFQAVNSQQHDSHGSEPNSAYPLEVHASQQAPNHWASEPTALDISVMSPPIIHRRGTHVLHSPSQSHDTAPIGVSDSLSGRNQSRAENEGVHTTQNAVKDLGFFHMRRDSRFTDQNFPFMNTMSTNSQRQEQIAPALGASQSQHNPGKILFYSLWWK